MFFPAREIIGVDDAFFLFVLRSDGRDVNLEPFDVQRLLLLASTSCGDLEESQLLLDGRGGSEWVLDRDAKFERCGGGGCVYQTRFWRRIVETRMGRSFRVHDIYMMVVLCYSWIIMDVES